MYRGIRDDGLAIVVKLLKQDYPAPQELTRYRQEYEITRSLNLKGVVKAYSQQDYQCTLVILLEDFGGESLEQWMWRHSDFCPMPLATFLRLAIALTDILSSIHAANIIHKDINPGGSCVKYVQEKNVWVAMEFPITDLLNREKCTQWIVEHFHPDGLNCPNCHAGVEQARKFRTTHRSQLTVYRCRVCDQTYNLYRGTVLAQHHLPPEQVMWLLRGIVKGESTKNLATELPLNYKTGLTLRHQLQERAEQLQWQEPLPDIRTETDEMLQNAGEKRNRAS